MTEADRIARAERAQVAYKEFIEPALTIARADYAKRLTDLAEEKPWEAQQIASLSVALKIARTVDEQVKAIIADGELAKQSAERASQIARISPHKRSILGL